MARKTLLKRVVSSFTAAALAIVAMPVIPAFAETGVTTYSFDGYDVEYSVKNEWTEGQSVEVKITNTGDEPILNWAFKYNAEGEIRDLWNASVYDTKETSYIIKNVGWNYEIAPDASVSFGYTLSDYSGTNPDKFELCAKRVDKTDGYDVQYNITNEWDAGLQGEIVITNTSEEPIEFWQLSFDSDVTIDNIWNSSVDKQEESHYTISGENTPINAGENKTFGFIGTKTSELNSISNFSLSTVVIEGLGENGSIFNNGKTDENNTENNNSEENENVVSEECYPYTLFAGSSDEGAITINADSFCVNGDIATNGTIVSSGNININGARKESAKERVVSIFKKLKKIYFSEENVEVYAEDYSVVDEHISINNPITVIGSLNLSGEINLSNAVYATNNVTISGNVRNADNAVIISENGDIIIDCNDFSVSGLIYAPSGNVNITAQNLNLNNAILIADTITITSSNVNINYSEKTAAFVGIESDDSIEVSAFGSFNSDTNSIDIKWFSNYKNSTYEIWTSDNGQEFILAASEIAGNQFQYPISDEFDLRYFKVVLITNYGEKVESFAFAMKKTAYGYSIELLDSDEDGIADIMENILETDPYKSDTDNDGLTDYQEFYITDTNPTVYDSVTKGISDADADKDNDGISNIKEIELGTNVDKKDTDEDGLADYEEVYTYGTDPLKKDTDGDGLIDGDELKIGLDPLNPETFGIPDSEYKIEQIIAATSEALSEINTKDNPYSLSIELNAAGYAPNTIDAGISSYSYSLSGNTAIVGNVVSLEYLNENYDSVKLNFAIKPEYLNNMGASTVEGLGLEGINRLQAFYYDKEYNDLYPVETNIQDNNLVVNASRLGNYCIIDLNNWLEMMEIDFSEIEESDLPTEEVATSESDADEIVSTQSVSLKFNAPAVADTSTTATRTLKTSNKHKVDLVYVIDTSGSMGTVLQKAKSSMHNLVWNLMMDGIDVNIAVVSYSDYTHDGANGAKTYMVNGSYWVSNPTDASTLINKVNLYGNGYETPLDGLGTALNELTFRDDASKFIVLIADEPYIYSNNRYGIKDIQQMADTLKANEIYTSVVCRDYSYDKSTFEPLYSTTHGIQIDIYDEWPINLEIYIKQYIKNIKSYLTVIPNSLEVIGLKEMPQNGSNVNSDEDDLYDYEEIDWDYIDETREELVLPKLGEYSLAKYGENYFDILPLNERQKKLVNAIVILPVTSNPTKADSDGDGLLDKTYTYDDNGNIIAPKDENVWESDGPIGLWTAHRDNLIRNNNSFPSELGKWYGRGDFEFPNIGVEGVGAFVSAVDSYKGDSLDVLGRILDNALNVSSYQIDLYSLLALTYFAAGDWEMVYENINNIANTIGERVNRTDKEFITEVAASLGSRLLNFKMDNEGMALHSQHYTWQAIGGYNNLYDYIFRKATGDNMDRLKLDFNLDMSLSEMLNYYGLDINSALEDYYKLVDMILNYKPDLEILNEIPDSINGQTKVDWILWAWRGDYLNIGPGAEVGLYFRPYSLETSSSDDRLDHYFVLPEMTVPMQLYLYNYNTDSSKYDNIISWTPTEDQWWVTGFNPYRVGQANVKTQIMVSKIDLSKFKVNEHNRIYEALKNDVLSNKDKSKFTVFDDDLNTVWIVWGDVNLWKKGY